MKGGREIIDIGLDPKQNKHNRGPFYKIKKEQITQKNYPVLQKKVKF
jgi:hypothetical protein